MKPRLGEAVFRLGGKIGFVKGQTNFGVLAVGTKQKISVAAHLRRLGGGNHRHGAAVRHGKGHLVDAVGNRIVVVGEKLVGQGVFRAEKFAREHDAPLVVHVGAFKDLALIKNGAVEGEAHFVPFLAAEVLTKPTKMGSIGNGGGKVGQKVVAVRGEVGTFHIDLTAVEATLDIDRHVGDGCLGGGKRRPKRRHFAGALGNIDEYRMVGIGEYVAVRHVGLLVADLHAHMEIAPRIAVNDEILCAYRKTRLPLGRGRGNVMVPENDGKENLLIGAADKGLWLLLAEGKGVVTVDRVVGVKRVVQK